MTYFSSLMKILLYYLSIFWVAIFASYLLFVYWGPDPSYQFLGKGFSEAEHLSQQLELGVGDTAFEHLKKFFFEILSFDFSNSYSNDRAVHELILEALPVSLWIGVPAFLLSESLAFFLALILCLFPLMDWSLHMIKFEVKKELLRKR